MLWHAIAPSRRFTKASHDVVRHPRLRSDAKILLLYVQGLPDEKNDRPLSEHARKLGITGRAYQRAKAELVMHGFVHERRETVGGGRWVTVQLFSNVPLTDDQAARLRVGATVDGQVPPSVQSPTVGRPRDRTVGGSLPVDEELEKNTPHPPPEAEEVPEAEAAPEVVEAERVLLSLRHERRELHLGVREARGLAESAAEWLRRGVGADDLRRALTSGLPEGGVRSAVGFLRHRLVHKLPGEVVLPEPRSPEPRRPEPAPQFVVCAGPGEEHVFRSVGGATHCGPCGREELREVWAAWKAEAATLPEPLPWRERFAELAAMRAREPKL
ncbi:hypothetical protein F0344_14985 [Streptomyces finlayi]|uniref:Helix-turn-helix domain-containing protein n=1 Tax=Streptomyces finlayi TaxID=67296 RepID=A0A7G7BK94_9ACTN|nr:hypothetical protein [Streptomyces finlayi]QNE75759.1 hypothetical protein F0344_14985 [Streptomyces finlayi]